MARVPRSGSGTKPLERLRLLITPVYQLAGLGVILAGVLTWGILLQLRVNALEAKLQAVLTSSPGQSSDNSLSAACANLAQRAADTLKENTHSSSTVVFEIKSLMKELGCMAKN